LPLSDVKIQKAKPRDEPFRMADGGGLYVLVNPTGSKLWRMDYRLLGKRRTLAVGAYPALSLLDARTRRDEAKKHIANGRDPVQQKQIARVAAVAAADDTFEKVVEDFLAKIEKDGLDPETIDKNRWMLGFATEVFGKTPITEVTPADCLVALRRIEKRGNYDTATRTRATIGRVFRYAIADAGRATRDVTADLRGALITPTVTHHPGLTDPGKVGGLLRSIEGYGGQASTRLALRIAPHIFLRPVELRFMSWVELPDLADKTPVWRIPPERMKKKKRKTPREHVIPLSSQVVAMLRELKDITGHGKYLFPSPRTPKKPISEVTLNAALRRMGSRPDEQTTHGLRTTASTLLNEARHEKRRKFDSDWIERQLHHVDENKVRGAYNAAEWIDDRREMMQWWSDYLDNLRDTAGLLG
jgi:integrase